MPKILNRVGANFITELLWQVKLEFMEKQWAGPH